MSIALCILVLNSAANGDFSWNQPSAFSAALVSFVPLGVRHVASGWLLLRPRLPGGGASWCSLPAGSARSCSRLHWDRAKLPFLGSLGLGFLSGALLVASGFSALKQGVTTGGNGEVTLPAFGAEVGRPAAAGGAEPEPKPTAKAAVAAPAATETLPFTPTARPKPFPYKDGPASAAVAVAADPTPATVTGEQPAPAEAAAAAPSLGKVDPLNTVSAACVPGGGFCTIA